jgi:uncharacterized membrane protein YccC
MNETPVRSDQLVTCEQVADELSGAADGTVSLSASARRHVETCLRCQAEAAQYRKLLRALRGLRGQLVEPAPGLLAELLDSLESGDRRAVRSRLTGRRAAYVGGLAAATAAGVGGALVLASRTRRRLPLAG